MTISNQKILILIIAITLVLFPLVALTSGALRIALGLLLVIFFPGYALLSALFPKRGDLGGVERVALSFGLSIAVVPLIGLILNYTPSGIRLYPICIYITLFILITSAIAWYRQQRLPLEERFQVSFNFTLPGWARMGRLDRALSIGLIVAIVAALGCLGYVIANPKQGERFTEFYISGQGGEAGNYITELVFGEEGTGIVGVVNHEYAPTSYRVEIDINGIEVREIYTGVLAHEEKWEQEVSFPIYQAGLNQTAEFWLYKYGETKPCFDGPLSFPIDVITFYLLNVEGRAGEYPQQVEQGEPVELIIGIVNDEYQPTSYRVEIKTDGILYKKINTEVLAYQEKWQEKVSFIPWIQKEKQKVEFWLYKSDEVEPYYEKPLYFYINVEP